MRDQPRVSTPKESSLVCDTLGDTLDVDTLVVLIDEIRNVLSTNI